MDHNLVN